jgi:hypothetical protein
MKALFWNIRGMGRKARVRHLKELIGGWSRLTLWGFRKQLRKPSLYQNWRIWLQGKVSVGNG